ncbi:Hypothetical_protein [Hexamita inflata]|uniref:Hypothetical_protein n=1 Tax=Hexamita inflata TaxID=28002 RepID=A0ABP1J0J8_9EUKA
MNIQFIVFKLLSLAFLTLPHNTTNPLHSTKHHCIISCVYKFKSITSRKYRGPKYYWMRPFLKQKCIQNLLSLIFLATKIFLLLSNQLNHQIQYKGPTKFKAGNEELKE